eukprot:5670857-Prymnesium_polylepis.2
MSAPARPSTGTAGVQYVALSRVTQVSGLTILGRLRACAIRADARVLKFFKDHQAEDVRSFVP